MPNHAYGRATSLDRRYRDVGSQSKAEVKLTVAAQQHGRAGGRLELLKKPSDVIKFRLRTAPFGTSAAQFVLDLAGTLALHLLGNPD